MQIHIQLNDQITAELARLAEVDRPAVMQELALAAAEMIRRLADDAFARSGTEFAPWVPRKDKKAHRLLQLTTRLRKSLRAQAEASGAAVFSDAPYAAIHQFGGSVQRKARTATLIFNGKGRFMSKAKAGKAKGPVRVGFAKIGAGTVNIPARPFIPVDAAGNLLPVAERKVDMAIRRKLASLLRRPDAAE